MDGIGAAASIIAVVELSAKIASICFQYSKDIKNARNDIARVQVEIDNIRNTANSALQLLNSPNGDRLKSSKLLLDAVKEAALRLEQLDAELRPPSTRKAMSRIGVRRLTWPFQSKDVEKAVQDIVRCTQTISASLHIDQISILLSLDQKTLLDKLPTASGASFDSKAEENNPTCLPNTRVDLLKQIHSWVDDPTAVAVFWLNGMAGTGKSTISRTVAKCLADTNKLGASFFFKREENDRSDASKLITTVASQLARRVPNLAGHIMEAIETDPTIVDKGLQKQFGNIILEPLSKVERDASCCAPIVIIVDALDECEREDDIGMIINLFSHARDLQSPRLKVLLTSRPELPVRLGFKQKAVEGTYTGFILHEIPEQIVEHDISVFLRHQLAVIKDSYNSIVPSQRQLPSTWPGQHNVETLVKMAVPLFIFAAITCRYLQQRRLGNPDQQLRQVLDYKTRVESSELDLSAKFELTYRPALDQQLADLSSLEQDRTIKQFRLIVGTIIILANPLSTTALGRLLDIPNHIIDDRLDMLHSVLDVPQDSLSPVRLLHLSFRDFLLDPEQQHMNKFWVDGKERHRQLAIRCLAILQQNLHADICDLRSPATPRITVDPLKVSECLPPEVQYTCLHWIYHTREARDSSDLADDVYNFLSQHFLHWIEALSLLGRLSHGALALQELLKLITMNSELHDFIQDATSVIPSFGSIIEHAPLQTYSTLLLFSPLESQVRKRFWDQRLPCLPYIEGVKSAWDSHLQTLAGHRGSVNAVAYSPDGHTLASASDDKTIRLWDTATGASRLMLEGHSRSINAMAFSANGHILASASDDKTIRVWGTATGASRLILEGHNHSINAVAFSPSGHTLASASDDKTIRLWDILTGTLKQTLEGHNGPVKVIDFSPDGQSLISASSAMVRIWDVTTGTPRKTLTGHDNWVLAVTFSPNNQVVALSSHKTILLYNATTGAQHKKLEGHNDLIHDVVFSPDGQVVASASFDKTVRIWDVATGAQRLTLEGHPNWVGHLGPATIAVAFSPDGKFIAAALRDRTVQLWDAVTGTEQRILKGHNGWVTALAFSPDSHFIASASQDRTVRLWSSKADADLQTIEGYSNSVHALISSPDNQLIASASNDNTVRLWDATTGILRQTLKGHNYPVASIEFSADSQTLASASADMTVRLWDITTGALRLMLGSPKSPRGFVARKDWVFSKPDDYRDSINAVAFSPDGSMIASALGDKEVLFFSMTYDYPIQLWDLEAGTSQQLLRGHSGSVNAVIFSPNGQIIASASADKTVRLWDVASGTQHQTLKGHSEGVNAVVFSPNGQIIASASADKTIRLWDVASGTQRQILKGHVEGINTIIFSPDGRIVVSASADETIRLWDIATGTQRQMLELGFSQSLIFDPLSSTRLLTDFGTVDLSSDSLACRVPTPEGAAPKSALCGFGLSPDKTWIVEGNERILWLPQQYRPTASAVRNSVIFIGCASGRVIRLQL